MTAYSEAKPWLDDGDLRLYHGDVLEVLRGFPAGIAQTCVTSPPYWGLRDYGTGTWTGGDPDCDHPHPKAGDTDRNLASSTLVGTGQSHSHNGAGSTCPRCGAERVDDQLGLEPTPDAYITRMVEVFREARRVLRDDGTLWLNIGDSYCSTAPGTTNAPERIAGANGREGERGKAREQYRPETPPGLKPKDLVGIPWRLAFALQADGWYLRSDIIWAKPNPMPESVTDRPTKAHEYVFLFSKRPRYFYDADAVREATVYTPEQIRRQVEAHQRRAAQNRDRGDDASVSDFGRWANRTEIHGAESGRNLRSVWQIPTQPFPEAHFATYPEELVRRCILAGTSDRGGCAECGAPWQRQVDVSYTDAGANNNSLKNKGGKEAWEGSMSARPYETRKLKNTETTGWEPSCSCIDGDGNLIEAGMVTTRPQLVLDPFIGSGTTALVARKHGRRSIGIDLSEEYLELAAKRTRQLSLFGAAQ